MGDTARGIIKGCDQQAGLFCPSDPILRAQMAALIARGYADGTYDPTGPVLHIQTIAFNSRAMVEQGWWQAQPDNPVLYPTIPASSGHREDIATWVRYAGPVPGMNTTTGDWSVWATPAERGWFALALWTAFDQHAQTERLP